MTFARRIELLGALCLTLGWAGPLVAQGTDEGPVKRWLTEHCKEIQNHYRDLGESATCNWENLSVTGRYPELTVSFTRVDNVRKQTARTVRLQCTPTECKVVEAGAAADGDEPAVEKAAVDKAGAEPASGSPAATPAPTAAPALTPVSEDVEQADGAVQIAIRRAEDRREEARRMGGETAVRSKWNGAEALLGEARSLAASDPAGAIEKARQARAEFVAIRRQGERRALDAAIASARAARESAKQRGVDRDPLRALDFSDADHDLSAATVPATDRIVALARAEMAREKFSKLSSTAPRAPAGAGAATPEDTRRRVESWLRRECGDRKSSGLQCSVEIRAISGVPADLTVRYVRAERGSGGKPVASVEGVVRLDCQGESCRPWR